MTKDVIVDDIYICSVFNSDTNEISNVIVDSIEGIKKLSEKEGSVVLSFTNIIGRDIKIGTTQIFNKLEITN